jgi:glucosamine kinase
MEKLFPGFNLYLPKLKDTKKMIIVAESGSTKTHWKVADKHGVRYSIETGGFNPNYFPATVLTGYLNQLASEINFSDLSGAYFYGSGCSSDFAKKIVQSAFGSVYPGLPVEVNHDLLGAARALFGKGNGIAAILGTGSSSCLMVDGNIASAVPSLGYLLADEGSGFHLGKLLLNSYFKNELSPHLTALFEKKFKIRTDEFLPHLYAAPKPNSLIASFVPFLVENKNETIVQQLIAKAFDDFFRNIILKYSDNSGYSLGFVGSVAFLFADVLKDVAAEHHLQIARIIRNPADDLVRHHLMDV